MSMRSKKEFLRGYALAHGFIIKAHGQGSMVRDAMREHGITLADLEKAGCDDFDLDPIREEFDLTLEDTT